MIRFAHEVSFVRLAVAIVAEHFKPVFRYLPNFVKDVEADCGLSDEARKRLTGIHERMYKLTFAHILSTSVVALPLLVVYAGYRLCRDLISGSNRIPEKILDHRLNGHMQLIEQQAVETRDEQMERFAAAGV